MSLRRRFGRRGFLSGIGAAAALAPFFPLGTSAAEDSTIPRRLILMFSPNGVVRDRWWPTVNGADFELGSSLAPLEPVREHLRFLHGLRASLSGDGDGHQLAMGTLWTGSGLLEDGEKFLGACGQLAGWSSGASVDQAIAQRIGSETPFASLELGVQVGSPNVNSRMCYSGPGQPVTPIDDPYTTFDLMFGQVGKDEAALAEIRARRASVIDLVESDLSRLRPRLDGMGREKLGAHLEAIREVERRLDLSKPYGQACSVPELGAPIDILDNDNFPLLGRLQTDLLVMALACDLTRVASLQWSRSASRTRYTWLGSEQAHHELSHIGPQSADATEQLAAIDRWYAEQFAYLVASLAAIPEGDGTMLDHTVVVWANELGDGYFHLHHPLPFVLAGHGGGVLAPGRVVDYGDVQTNRLFVSLCHLMGLDDVETFGTTDVGNGPLPDLG